MCSGVFIFMFQWGVSSGRAAAQIDSLQQTVTEIKKDIDNVHQQHPQEQTGIVGKKVVYPDDRRIAHFNSGTGAPARTANGEHISICSDSAWNGKSWIAYQRVDGTNEGEGFLRVHYDLQAAEGKRPYVGLFWNLDAQGRPVDISRFSAIRLRVRNSPALTAVEELDPSEIQIFLGLKDDSIAHGEDKYAAAEAQILHEPLGGEWRTIQVQLSDLKTAAWANQARRLDLKSVVQMIVAIKGREGSKQSGVIDLDALEFRD